MKYDVIVVGAGPAGSSTARVAAENGLKTLLLERDEYPGKNNACAAGLNPYTVKSCNLDSSLIERHIYQIRLYADGIFSMKKPAIIPFSSSGATTQRKKFDKYLADLAVDSGAELRTKSLVKKVENNKVYTNDRTFQGEVIVGADGTNSVVARAMNLKPFKPWQLAAGALYEIKMDEDKIDEKYGHGIEFHYYRNLPKSAGGAWVFPARDFLNVGVADLMSRTNNDLKLKLDLFVKRLGIKGKIKTYRGGVFPIAGPWKKTVLDTEKRKYLLVGDAAGQCGPAFGEGIHYALEIGKLAGKSCAKYFEGKKLSCYELAWKSRYRLAYLIEHGFQLNLYLMDKMRTIPFLFTGLGYPPFRFGAQAWAESSRKLIK